MTNTIPPAVESVIPATETVNHTINTGEFKHLISRISIFNLLEFMGYLAVLILPFYIIILLEIQFNNIEYYYIVLISIAGILVLRRILKLWYLKYSYYITDTRIIQYRNTRVGTSSVTYMDIGSVHSYMILQPRVADRYFNKFTLRFKTSRGCPSITGRHLTHTQVSQMLTEVVENCPRFDREQYEVSGSNSIINNSSWGVIDPTEEILFTYTDSVSKRIQSICYSNIKQSAFIFISLLFLFQSASITNIILVLTLALAPICLKVIPTYLFQENRYIITPTTVVSAGLREGTARLRYIPIKNINSVSIEQNKYDEKAGIQQINISGDDRSYGVQIHDIATTDAEELVQTIESLQEEALNTENSRGSESSTKDKTTI